MRMINFISACSLVLLALSLVNCNSNKDKSKTDKIVFNPTDENFNIIHDKDTPEKLVALLDNSSDLEGEHIGIEGKESVSFKVYKRFSLVTSDTALVRLTYHKNPKIRIYSMWALIKKNRALALQQYKHLKNDKAIITFRTCDVSISLPVSSYLASYFRVQK